MDNFKTTNFRIVARRIYEMYINHTLIDKDMKINLKNVFNSFYKINYNRLKLL